MARKVHEISFAIAGRMAGSFKGAFASASSQLRGLNSDSKSLKVSLRELDQAQKNGSISTQTYQSAHQRLTSQLEKTIQAQQRLASVTQRQNELQQQAGDIRGQALDTAAVASPFVASAKAAMQFEDAMLGVAKQAEGARDKQGQLTSVYFDMRKEIQLLGREIPISTNKIAGMVEAGLRMNVPKDQVIGFTREVAKMSTAFDGMEPSEIADKMGKISNVMQIPITKISDLADTINYLDDNSVTKGADLIGTLTRIGGTAKQVNLAEHQAAALASTFLSLGKSEEVAATASNALMRELALAKVQPDRFQKALKSLGMTSKEVNEGMVKDAQGTILKVLDKINGLDKKLQVEITTGLFGKEYGDDVAALAGGINEYRRQLSLLNEEERKGSMDREFSARLQVSSAQMEMMKNSATETAVALGTVLLPPLNETFQMIAKGAQVASEFAAAHPQLTEAVVVGATAVVGARIAWLALKFAWTQTAIVGNGVKSVFIKQSVAQTAATSATARHATAQLIATGATGKLTIAQRALNLAMRLNPVGMVITAIGVLIGLGVLLYQNWDTVKTKAAQMFKVIGDNPFLAIALGPLGMLIYTGVKLYENFDMIKFKAGEMWAHIENSFRSGVNGSIALINTMIDGINKIPGVEIGHIQSRLGGHSVTAADYADLSDNSARRMIDGSHASGLSYVPWDGYIGELHKGERVLTAQENKEYTSGSLWSKADSLGGSSRGVTYHITYSPTITGGNREEIEPILREDKRNLEKQLQSIQHQQGRTSFGR